MANNYPNLRPTLNIDNVNGIYVDNRITFTRAGTRTHFGREMVKAEENLFIRSQEFSNAAWLIDAVTLSTVTAPDGTSTASKMLPTAVSAAHYIYGAASNKPKLASATYTKSVRIKADGYGFATVSIAGTGSAIYVAATFDLSGAGAVTKTGVGGSGGTLVGSSITALAGGWYQCTVTGSVTQAAGFDLISVATTGTPTYGNYGLETFTGDGTSAIQIWGAQLEQRSSPTAYTATTTQPITRYQRRLLTAAANEWPREFDPVTGECLGRSVWEARTNLFQRSEEFDNAYWTKSATGINTAIGTSGIEPNVTIAPDGTLTADRVNFLNQNDSDLGLTRSLTGTGVAGNSFTSSFFVKGEGDNIGKTVRVRIKRNSGGAFVDDTRTTVLTGQWQRLDRTITLVTDNVGTQTTVSSMTGEATSCLIWGGMLEQGLFATPYIPTVAAQVTRVADSAVMTGVNFSSWFNPEQGSFVASALTANTAATGGILSAEDGTTSNRMQLRNNSSGVMSWTSVITGTADVAITNGSFAANIYKLGAATYKFNDYAASCDGAAVSTDTVARVPIVDRLVIGGGTSQNLINGYIRRLTYYPQALTAANLQAVTR